jgi:enoyl-CoA hydratase
MPDYKDILYQVKDHIAVITLNRPEALNAWYKGMNEELRSAARQIDDDPQVRVLVITGSGQKSFCSGIDLKKVQAGENFITGPDIRDYYDGIRKMREVFTMYEKLTVPVIAAINGYCLGGGLELALACDFIYASTNARLGFPEVTLGIMPGFGGTQNLARLIGPSRASELVFTGKMIDAAKAAAWGIVNEVLPPEELLAKAKETAALIAGMGTLGVAYAKDAIANGLNMTREDGFRYEAALFGVLFATEDQKEGMGAFVEKRPAEFKAR